MRHLALLAVPLVACQELPRQGSLGADHDRLVARELRGGSLVGAVLEGGEAVRFAGYGETRPDGPTPTKNDRYRVGSLSKSFTALALLSQRDDGLVDLDAPLTDALPSFATGSVPSRPLTARDLLTHQSGLVGDLFDHMIADEDVPSIEETTARLASEPLASEPGAQWAYSNVGFNVLGQVVQELDGVPFEEAVRTRVFEPCGMDGANWSFEPTVSGYDGRSTAHEGTGISTPPAGAAVASVTDLARFADGLVSGGACAFGPIVSPETFEEATSPQVVAAVSGEIGQGLGFFLDPDGVLAGGHAVVAHPGDTVLFHTVFLVVPDLGFGVLTMGSERESGGLAWDLAFALLEEEIEARTGEPVPEPEPPAVERHPADLAPHEGVYTGELGVIDLRQRGDGLDAAGDPFRLVPTVDGTFRIRPRILGLRLPMLIDDAELRFRTVDGRDLVQGFVNGGYQTLGERVDPPQSLHGWTAGRWVLADPSSAGGLGLTGLDLDVDRDGFLVATVTVEAVGEELEMPYLLRPTDRDHARVDGIGRYHGQWVVRDGDTLTMLGARFVPR